MHDHRRAAVPALHEADQFVDVLLGRMGIAVDRGADVVHAEDEMIGPRDRRRALNAIDQAQQGDDMACAGFGDGAMQAGEGADVDHPGESGLLLLI